MSDGTIKARKLQPGETIEVNDIIVSVSWTGKKTYRVKRVTPKYAFVRWNDVAEGSFKRDGVQTDGDVKLRGSDTWSLVRYTAYREVKENG